MTNNRKRVAVVQWEDGLIVQGAGWTAIQDLVRRASPDILVTNELPSGPWIAARPTFEQEVADRSVADHDAGMAALRSLQATTIVSSRPITESGRLANEAVLIDRSGIRAFHRKQYLPDEPGWHETTWYGTHARDFSTIAAAGLELGVLLCTEAMFNEHARAYGRAGAHLIAIPRATGSSIEPWHLAGRMAALVSGCYVVSSNRVGSSTRGGPLFGGEGFAYAPDGQLLGITTAENPLFVFEVDSAVVRDARKLYPRYVAERS